jgi:hypothetical protein
MGKALVILAALAVVTVPAEGQSSHDQGRTLNGYAFVPSLVARSPFPVTSIGSHTGGAVAFDVRTPFIDFDGDTLGTLSGDVASVVLAFDYQQRFGEWFAARVEISALARAGTNDQSALAEGVTGGFSWDLGATARLLRRPTVILSAAVDVGRSDLVGINAYRFAQEVIDSGLPAAADSLLVSGNVTGGEASVRVGWAPTTWVGITGSLWAGVSKFANASSQTFVGGSTTIGIDLANLGVIPIGVQLSAAVNSNGRTDSNQVAMGLDDLSGGSSVGVGVFYTGWPDFSIGFETTVRRADRAGANSDFDTVVGTFNLRYWP